MTTNDLKERIKSTGMYPITIEYPDTNEEEKIAWFDGSLDGFVEAAKAFNSAVIFLSSEKLEEDDFVLEVDDDDDDTEESDVEITDSDHEDDEPIDLVGVMPSLGKFKKHVGQECYFLLTAKSQLGELSYLLTETWWDDFRDEKEKAVANVLENREAIREKLQASRDEKEKKLLAGLRRLLDEPEFCRLTTQRAMKSYALEQFPELEDVDDERLKEEIQKLYDKASFRKRK